MAKEKVTKKSNPTKKLSPYNMFMKTELAKVKQADSTISHKDAFKLAAKNWAASPENPKNMTKKTTEKETTEEKK